MVQMPSPAMSVLKSYLVNRGFDVGIIYWNLKLYELQVDFTWSIAENIDSDMINSLLLYYNYLAIKNNDREAYSRVKSSLMSIKPNYMSADPYMYDRHMHGFAEKLDNTYDEHLFEEAISILSSHREEINKAKLYYREVLHFDTKTVYEINNKMLNN